ncbi:MAG: hypothetical protein ACT4PZ_00190 [Panacagrimonas sp.]
MNIVTRAVVAGLLAISATAAVADDDALSATLKEREGKLATLVLTSGTELTGKVASVSKDSVKLVELSGKEFFDAVIDLDHVQAILVRAR